MAEECNLRATVMRPRRRTAPDDSRAAGDSKKRGTILAR